MNTKYLIAASVLVSGADAKWPHQYLSQYKVKNPLSKINNARHHNGWSPVVMQLLNLQDDNQVIPEGVSPQPEQITVADDTPKKAEEPTESLPSLNGSPIEVEAPLSGSPAKENEQKVEYLENGDYVFADPVHPDMPAVTAESLEDQEVPHESVADFVQRYNSEKAQKEAEPVFVAGMIEIQKEAQASPTQDQIDRDLDEAERKYSHELPKHNEEIQQTIWNWIGKDQPLIHRGQTVSAEAPSQQTIWDDSHYNPYLAAKDPSSELENVHDDAEPALPTPPASPKAEEKEKEEDSWSWTDYANPYNYGLFQSEDAIGYQPEMQNLSWFGKFFSKEQKDDSGSKLETIPTGPITPAGPTPTSNISDRETFPKHMYENGLQFLASGPSSNKSKPAEVWPKYGYENGLQFLAAPRIQQGNYKTVNENQWGSRPTTLASIPINNIQRENFKTVNGNQRTQLGPRRGLQYLAMQEHLDAFNQIDALGMGSMKQSPPSLRPEQMNAFNDNEENSMGQHQFDLSGYQSPSSMHEKMDAFNNIDGFGQGSGHVAPQSKHYKQMNEQMAAFNNIDGFGMGSGLQHLTMKLRHLSKNQSHKDDDDFDYKLQNYGGWNALQNLSRRKDLEMQKTKTPKPQEKDDDEDFMYKLNNYGGWQYNMENLI